MVVVFIKKEPIPELSEECSKRVFTINAHFSFHERMQFGDSKPIPPVVFLKITFLHIYV
jgi:hypothetical protein